MRKCGTSKPSRCDGSSGSDEALMKCRHCRTIFQAFPRRPGGIQGVETTTTSWPRCRKRRAYVDTTRMPPEMPAWGRTKVIRMGKSPGMNVQRGKRPHRRDAVCRKRREAMRRLGHQRATWFGSISKVVGHHMREKWLGGTLPAPQMSRSTTSKHRAFSTMCESWVWSPNHNDTA